MIYGKLPGINPTSTLGYYPNPNEILPTITGVAGIILPDNKSPAKQCKTTETTPKQDERMLTAMGERITNPGTYTAPGNNYVDFIRGVLKSAEIPTYETMVPFRYMDHLEDQFN